MRRGLLGLLLLGLLLAGPASAGCAPTPSRFVAQGAEVVDPITRLTWARCSLGQTWDESDGKCHGSVQLVTYDQAVKQASPPWRLPTETELMSLVIADCRSPALDEAAFPDTDPLRAWYWTSSSMTASSFWVVYFVSGSTSPIGRAFVNAARLVRASS
jgi:hypothetical protein